MLPISGIKKLTRKCRKQSYCIMYMFKYLMYIFKNQMAMFGYFKIPDTILSLVSVQKLDWTRTFDTHCISVYICVYFSEKRKYSSGICS